MLILICLISSLLTSISSQDIMCVAYSFAEDFYGSFDRRGCPEKESTWELVNYKSLGMIPPHQGSATAIKASFDSCSSSFPIVFFPGELLEVEVLIISMVLDCGIKIAVYDIRKSKDLLIARITRYASDDISEWTIISLPIEKKAKNGYIKISSFCEEDAQSTILVDSFRYLPTTSSKKGCEVYPRYQYESMIDKNSNVTTELEDDELFPHNKPEERNEEGSGDEPGGDPVDNNSFWNPLTIALVTIGGVGVLALVGVGAYQFGKMRGLEASFSNLADIEEEEPTRTIPRARSVYRNPLVLSGRDF